jgi:hypothetical protein
LLAALTAGEIAHGLVTIGFALFIWAISTFAYTLPFDTESMEGFVSRAALAVALASVIFPPALVFWANRFVDKEKDPKRFGGALRADPMEKRVRSLCDDPIRQARTDQLECCRGHKTVIARELYAWKLQDKVYGILEEMKEHEGFFDSRDRQDQVEVVCRRALFLYLSEEEAAAAQ